MNPYIYLHNLRRFRKCKSNFFKSHGVSITIDIQDLYGPIRKNNVSHIFSILLLNIIFIITSY